MVINPNGDILVELNREEATISVDINIQEVSRQRDAIPIFRNLKPHLYKLKVVSLGETHDFT